MYTRKMLAKRIKRLGRVIEAPEELLDGFTKKNQYAHPYIECIFPFYYLTTKENGIEIERERFLIGNVDMLLYSVFKKIIFDMALQYELRHRIPNQDSRRLLFAHRLELMEKLSPKWKNQLQNEISDILKLYPYRDDT